MTYLIGRTAAPLPMPTTAILVLDAIDQSKLVSIASALDDAGFLTNAVGISANRLHLTSYIDTAEKKAMLQRLGFVVDKKIVALHALCRRPDATKLTPLELANILDNVITMRQLVVSTFQGDTKVPVNQVLAHAAECLSVWYLPATLKQVCFVMPDHSKDTRPFDELVLQTLHPLVSKSDPLPSFQQLLTAEARAWRDAVTSLYSSPALSLVDPFDTWLGGYTAHLYTLYRERFYTGADATPNLGVDEIPPVDLTVAPSSVNVVTAEELLTGPEPADVLTGILAVKDVVTPGKHDRLVRPPVPPTEGIVTTRMKAHLSFEAFRVPDAPADPRSMVELPFWAMQELMQAPYDEPSGWSLADRYHALAGQWLVRLPFGVYRMTPEQFAYNFDVINAPAAQS